MFIPVWLFHVIVTIIFILVLIFWAWKNESGGDLDFSGLFAIMKTLVCALGYAACWIIYLIVLVNKKT